MRGTTAAAAGGFLCDCPVSLRAVGRRIQHRRTAHQGVSVAGKHGTTHRGRESYQHVLCACVCYRKHQGAPSCHPSSASCWTTCPQIPSHALCCVTASQASGNWMWAAKMDGEGASMYDCAMAMRDIMLEVRGAACPRSVSISRSLRRADTPCLACRLGWQSTVVRTRCRWRQQHMARWSRVLDLL
jgi:hypothetical protein